MGWRWRSGHMHLEHQGSSSVSMILRVKRILEVQPTLKMDKISLHFNGKIKIVSGFNDEINHHTWEKMTSGKNSTSECVWHIK